MPHSPNEERSASQPDLSIEAMGSLNYVSTRKRKQHSDLDDVASLRSENKDMLAAFKVGRESQDAIFNKAIDEIKKQNEQIIQTNSNIERILEQNTLLHNNLHQQVQKIAAEHHEAIIKIEKLENQVEELQRAQRSTTLEIRNIPETTGENLSNLLSKVHNALQVPFSCDSVRQVRRIKNGQNKLIIVEYQTTSQSTALIKALKEYNTTHKEEKLTTRCLDIQGDKQPVYISEALTPEARKLLYFARDLRKTHNFKFCWTRHGRVFVKKTDNSSTIMIKSTKQIEDLKEIELVQ